MSINKQLIESDIYLNYKLNELKSELIMIVYFHKFKPGYFTDLTLNILVIEILELLIELFTYRGTLVWPTKVYDKRTL